MTPRVRAVHRSVLLLTLLLGAGALCGCRTQRVTPYAWKATAADPRLSVRVPADTPGAEPVPERERLPPGCRATVRDEIEWEDPRLACCPEPCAEEPFKRNEASVFLGYTGVRAGDGGTFGLTYHRMLRHNFGLSVWAEYVFGRSQVPVAGLGVVFRPTEDARIMVSGGVADEEDHRERGVNALIRFGAMYRVGRIGPLDVFPAAYVDLVEHGHSVLLIGVEIGREF